MANGWTKTPNEILEAFATAEMSSVETKLTAALARQTFGWQRNQVRLTWEDISRLTSIKGRASISKAIAAVEARGFFSHGRKSLWSINSSMFELFRNGNSSDIEPHFVYYSSDIEPFEDANSSDIELEESSNIEPPSIKEKKEEKERKKEPPPTPQDDYQKKVWDGILTCFHNDQEKATAVLRAQAAFADIARLKQPYLNGNQKTYDQAEERWWNPLDQMLADADDSLTVFEATIKQVMAAADAPDGGFTIASPSSAVKTYAALLAKQQRNGTIGNKPKDDSWLENIPTFTDEEIASWQ